MRIWVTTVTWSTPPGPQQRRWPLPRSILGNSATTTLVSTHWDSFRNEPRILILGLKIELPQKTICWTWMMSWSFVLTGSLQPPFDSGSQVSNWIMCVFGKIQREIMRMHKSMCAGNLQMPWHLFSPLKASHFWKSKTHLWAPGGSSYVW